MVLLCGAKSPFRGRMPFLWRIRSLFGLWRYNWMLAAWLGNQHLVGLAGTNVALVGEQTRADRHTALISEQNSWPSKNI